MEREVKEVRLNQAVSPVQGKHLGTALHSAEAHGYELIKVQGNHWVAFWDDISCQISTTSLGLLSEEDIKYSITD